MVEAEPRVVEFFIVPVSHDFGVHDCEIEIDGICWVLVEYLLGLGCEEWCDMLYFGYVVSGMFIYSFEDGRVLFVLGEGDGFVLLLCLCYRGCNGGW